MIQIPVYTPWTLLFSAAPLYDTRCQSSSVYNSRRQREDWSRLVIIINYRHFEIAQSAVCYLMFWEKTSHLLIFLFVSFTVDARPLHPVLQPVFGGGPGAASFCGSCSLCTVGRPRGASSRSQRLRVCAKWLCTLVSRMTLSDIYVAQPRPIMTDCGNVKGNCPVRSMSSHLINTEQQ